MAVKMEEYTGGSVEAEHLCVLVHGVSFCPISHATPHGPKLSS
jgi:hypothetical protein